MGCDSSKVSETEPTDTTRESCSEATGTVAGEKEENIEHTTDSQVMRSLPPELLQQILSFCETDSLGRLRRVSHHLKSIVDDYIDRLPRSADLLRRSRKGAVRDGEYHLAVTSDRFGIVPLRVYCHGMSTENPKEYITLRHDGRDDNFSELTKGGFVEGPGVRTSFRKVRLDVANMQLVCSDFTFAQSEGWGSMQHGHGSLLTLYNHMPLGNVQTCGTSIMASANIDLRGTGLRIDCSLKAYGWYATGKCEFKEHRQVVSIKGGGTPGGCGPKSASAAHVKSCKVGSEPCQMEKIWEDIPVVVEVKIAEGGNRPELADDSSETVSYTYD